MGVKLIANILLFVYFLGLSASFAAVVNYYSNFEFITEVLCLNRNEPVTACNGSCYLRIQLHEPDNQIFGWELNFYAIPHNPLNLKNISEVKVSAIYILKDYPKLCQKVFHPPERV